jgi:acetyl esterase/lipase
VWARTRTIMRAITPSLPYQTQVDRTGVHEARIDIPSRDGTSLPAILYRPASPTSPGPLVVLYHGGGWITGHAEDEAPIAYALAQRHGAVVVSVEYRLAPEHPFPKAIEDSWDALKWVCDWSNPAIGVKSAGLKSHCRPQQMQPHGVRIHPPISS